MIHPMSAHLPGGTPGMPSTPLSGSISTVVSQQSTSPPTFSPTVTLPSSATSNSTLTAAAAAAASSSTVSSSSCANCGHLRSELLRVRRRHRRDLDDFAELVSVQREKYSSTMSDLHSSSARQKFLEKKLASLSELLNDLLSDHAELLLKEGSVQDDRRKFEKKVSLQCYFQLLLAMREEKIWKRRVDVLKEKEQKLKDRLADMEKKLEEKTINVPHKTQSDENDKKRSKKVKTTGHPPLAARSSSSALLSTGQNSEQMRRQNSNSASANATEGTQPTSKGVWMLSVLVIMLCYVAIRLFRELDLFGSPLPSNFSSPSLSN